MAKELKREISVVTLFEGNQDGRQAFIELILKKRWAGVHMKKLGIDATPHEPYTNDKVFSDVRVG